MNHTTPQSTHHQMRWQALAVLCAAQFMVIMDTSIIGVALPAIQQSLNYTSSQLQWIFNAYVIVFGGILLLGGKLSDIYGPKNIFMLGFAILTLSSLYTGLAWSEASMNIGRALQGLGAALIAPSALTLLMTIFTDSQELGKALGFWGASAAAGGSAGVFLGGLLTEYVSWRATFFINIPIGILVMVAGAYLLIKGYTQKGKIDYLGAILGTAATTIMVFMLVMVGENGWLSISTIGLLLASIVLFLLFVMVQKSSNNPLVPLQIFKRPNLTAGNLVMALLAGSWIPLWFYLNLYLQQILGYSAFYSGLALLPMTIAIMILMVGLSGKIIAAIGYKSTLVIGLIILTLSLFSFSFVAVNGSFWVHVLGPSLLGALGMSLAYIPGTIASMSGVKQEETGTASGLVNTTYQVGSAIGLAIVVGMVMTATQQSGGAIDQESLNEGFRTAFRTASVISGISVMVALFAIKRTN